MSDGAEEAGTDRPPLADRELSWLAFNARVLQEAADPSVPLFERLAFLGIFSSNLDEFFRVRVASLRSLLRLKKKRVRRLSVDPIELLSAIRREVDRQQAQFRDIFQDRILPGLEARGIHLTAGEELDAGDRERLRELFEDSIRPLAVPAFPTPGESPPFLDGRTVHLVVELHPDGSVPVAPSQPELALVPVPSPPLDRFVVLGPHQGRHDVMFLDDVLRLHLSELFPDRQVAGSWAVKLSRDAELYLEDEFAGDVVEAIRKSLRKRETGAPTRFLYDPATPIVVMERLREILGLEPEDLVAGGRYHNLHDLRTFPRCGVRGEEFEPWPPVPHPVLTRSPSVSDVVEREDQLLHFPYQSYDQVVRFLTEAAQDPDVTEIWLTVYRVSRESSVLRALLDAAERGKLVRVFVEVKARFDEATNLAWAERLERAGIVTLYSMPDLKVHAKLALVIREKGGVRRRQAYLGTGNFNEETARFYTDYALLTSHADLTEDLERVFQILAGSHEIVPVFRSLMVAPFDLRDRVYELIDREAERARRGEPAGITFKLNALEDEAVITRLYEAARAGVRIRGVVRGICRMIPGVPGWSEHVELRSIVDRYLEHGRIYVFAGGGDPAVYLSSADWMHRNLSRRIEVAFPVLDPTLRSQVIHGLELELADTRKARIIDEGGTNAIANGGAPPLRSQAAIRDWLGSLTETTVPEG